MSMDKIYFLILNYRTKEETTNCVYTIRKLDMTEHEKCIVIIDNASEDGSFEYLKHLYEGDKDIELYEMRENIGFSKANNYGYNLIRNRKDAAFIIVCNSDIEFCQRDILVRILEEYEQSRFYIAGPCVFCENDKTKIYRGYQSPAYPYEWREWYVKSREVFFDIQLKKVQNVGLTSKELLFGVKLINVILKVITKTVYFRYRKLRHENVPLHGSCIILSRLFIEKEKILFYPETQFYGEELLLYLRARRNLYKIVYNPEMLVYHMQGRATEKLGQNKETEIFRLRNLKNAATVFREEVGKNGKNNNSIYN